MWFEVAKKLLGLGVNIYKGITLKQSAKHSGGILLVATFLLSVGAINKDVFDILIQIIPNLDWHDYLAFGTLLALGYIIWLLLDLVKAYKNYLVRKIENKDVAAKDSREDK